MRILRSIVLGTPLIVLGLIGSPRADAGADDDAAIRKLVAGISDAFRAKDVDKLMTFYQHGDDLVVFDVVPPRQYTGWDAYRKDFQRMFDAFDGPITFDVGELAITTDGTMAYSHSIDHVRGTLKNGATADHTVRVTDVYRKIGGRWLIVHEHISVPVDLATGTADLQSRSR